MSGEILLISPQREFTNLLEKVRREFDDLNIIVHESTFEDVSHITQNMIPQNLNHLELIASGGATLNLLRQDLGSIPWVNIYPTEYDLALALEQVKKLQCKIGVFFADQERTWIVNTISCILGFSVNVYVYHNWHEILTQIENARRDQVELVIGAGEKIAAMVEQNGMKYISVMCGENTIRAALGRAKDILDAKHRENTVFEYMKEITNYSNLGIISINEKRVFTIFNTVAERFFGLKETEVIGRTLADLSHCRDLIKLFESSYKKLDYVMQTSKGAIMVNRIPHFDNQNLTDIFITFNEATSIRDDGKLNRDVLEKGFVSKYCFDDIIHHSPKMERVIVKAKKYANSDSVVLIRGESGTGKELLAQSLHNGHQSRRKKPFIAVNCASLEDNLLKSELFGYTEGSFTGAVKGGKQGLFELAKGGTLFLDEIGKMKTELQGSLLRVLQEKEVRRIGSDRIIPVDVRIIAASNENLEGLVRKGVFREDLYFRLNVLQINLPALRERKEDIPALVHFLLRKLTQKYARPYYPLPQSIMDKMLVLEWQGNVRQLENFLERCIILCEKESDWVDLVYELLEEESHINIFTDDYERDKDRICVRMSTLEEMNAEIIQSMREKTRLSNTELALKLGISRPTLLKALSRRS